MYRNGFSFLDFLYCHWTDTLRAASTLFPARTGLSQKLWNIRNIVLTYIYILSFFHSFFRKDANRLVFEWNEWWANRLEIQINRIAHDIASYRIQVAPKPGSTNCARRMALRAHRQLLVFCPGVQLVADQSNI